MIGLHGVMWSTMRLIKSFVARGSDHAILARNGYEENAIPNSEASPSLFCVRCWGVVPNHSLILFAHMCDCIYSFNLRR